MATASRTDLEKASLASEGGAHLNRTSIVLESSTIVCLLTLFSLHIGNVTPGG